MREPHDILLCIPDTEERLQDEDRMRYEGGQYYLKSPEEMQNGCFRMPEKRWTIQKRLQKRCNVEIVFGEQKVPKFDVPEGYTCIYLFKKAL
ncbi:MAG: hypothetical protein ACLTS6_05120 [Anaerobutyricum sp.]